MSISQFHATAMVVSAGPKGSGLMLRADFVLALQSCDTKVNQRKQKGLAVSQAFKEFGCGGRI